MLKLDVDVSGLESLASDFRRTLPGELLGVAYDLSQQAEQDAKTEITRVIYNTPERGGYERTGALRDSIKGFAQVDRAGVTVGLEARGGAEGREYASYTELGTRGSFRDVASILADARDAPFGALASYSRSTGLEPRPYLYPALAEAERNLEGAILDAVDKAKR